MRRATAHGEARREIQCTDQHAWWMSSCTENMSTFLPGVGTRLPRMKIGRFSIVGGLYSEFALRKSGARAQEGGREGRRNIIEIAKGREGGREGGLFTIPSECSRVRPREEDVDTGWQSWRQMADGARARDDGACSRHPRHAYLAG